MPVIEVAAPPHPKVDRKGQPYYMTDQRSKPPKVDRKGQPYYMTDQRSKLSL